MDILLMIGLCIAIAFIWMLLMKEQRKLYNNENLTTKEKPIKITIENYCGQRITFTMSSEAEIESSVCIEDSIVTKVHINAHDKDILIEKEDI